MFYVDVNYLDKWEEKDHPRAKGGEKGGQFVKKGMGGGPAAPKVNLAKFIAEHIKKGTPQHELISHLKTASAGHINQQYVQKIYGQEEKKHGLPKGYLTGTNKGGYTPPKPAPTPPPSPPAAKPTPQPAPQLQPGHPFPSWYNPANSFIVNIADIQASNEPPLIKAQRIKYVGLQSPHPNAVGWASHQLTLLEKDHGQPPGTYNSPGWDAGKGSQPTPAPAPQPAKALTQPYSGSAHQQNLYNMASGAGTVQEKIAKMAAYPTVQNYPDGYAAKYAHQLATELGGTWPTPAAKPTPQPTPTPAKPTPPPNQPNIIKPPANLHPTLAKRRQQYLDIFNAAQPSKVNYWDQAAAEKTFKSAIPSEFKKYSSSQKATIKYYCGPGSGSINHACREPPSKVDSHTLDHIHELSSTFEEAQSVTTEDVKLWRGVDASAQNLKKWENYLSQGMKCTQQLDGFSSCSFYKDRPAFDSRPIWYEIAVPKGSKMVAVNMGTHMSEGEVLLDNQQSVEILEIEHNAQTPSGKRTVVRMVVVK